MSMDDRKLAAGKLLQLALGYATVSGFFDEMVADCHPDTINGFADTLQAFLDYHDPSLTDEELDLLDDGIAVAETLIALAQDKGLLNESDYRHKNQRLVLARRAIDRVYRGGQDG